ncbi:ROK family glucokinase [Salirhabdus salicampi]|uniref:ROK family glucokinase n=1 Tax=Salirhabdus salicampi TaxID=476102 RepID=UPI0020C349D0|nr:ROK family glucokinase [Salirhabdus salicampi]MCP8616858.1 ROK family glucokinase [Salirhabdus salicampi]
MEDTYYLGIDIGGTTVKIAFVTKTGEIFYKWEIKTDKSDDGINIPKDIFDSVQDKMQSLSLGHNNLMGLGVGAPGFIDEQSGEVEAVNIGWTNFPLKEKLADLFQLPTYVLNDANLAALGENWVGAGGNVPHLIAVTLGTGVGGGVVVNGHVINGVNGTGGEIGHITVTPNEGPRCNCGRQGCLETYASATAVSRLGVEAAKREQTSLKSVYEKKGTVTAKDVFQQAKRGDVVANNIVSLLADKLGLVLANLAITTNPEKIVIGGGMAQAGELLLLSVKNAFEGYTLKRTAAACEFSIAKLGNDAGVIGGAYLVKQQTEK